MKKIIGVLVSFVLFFTATFAFDFNPDKEELLVFGACDTSFTQSERTQLYNLANFLDTKNTIIANKFPGSSELTEAFAKQIYNSLEQSCEPDVFSNYREFKKGFSLYISNLSTGTYPDHKQIEQIDLEAKQAIVQLQKHITDLLTPGYDQTKPHNISSNTNISFNVDEQNEGILLDIDMQVGTKGKYNLMQNEFDIDINIDANIEGSEQGEFTNNAGSLDFNLAMSLIQKDDLYIALKALIFNINSEDLEPAEQMQIAMVQGMINAAIGELNNKYINITAGTDKYTDKYTDTYTQKVFNNIFVKTQTVIDDVNQNPIIDFQKQNNTTRHGKFNNNVCGVIKSLGINENDCSDELFDTDTLILKKHGQEYTLGTNIFDKIFSRTPADITSIKIPMDEKIVIDVDIEKNNTSNKYQTNIYADILEDNTQIGNLTLTSEEEINYLPNINIQAPQEVITIQELETIFSEMGL